MFLKLLRYSYSSGGKSFASQLFSVATLFSLIDKLSKRMEQSKTPLWRRSMLNRLNFYGITELLNEIGCNGDPYGYDWGSTDSYFDEYKPFFDELADGAYSLSETMQELKEEYVYKNGEGEFLTVWDDFTVALLGEIDEVLGYDTVQQDYFHMIGKYDREIAIEEATKTLMNC